MGLSPLSKDMGKLHICCTTVFCAVELCKTIRHLKFLGCDTCTVSVVSVLSSCCQLLYGAPAVLQDLKPPWELTASVISPVFPLYIDEQNLLVAAKFVYVL